VGSYQSNIEIRNANTKRTYLSKNFSSVNQSQQNSTELFSILYCALLEEKIIDDFAEVALKVFLFKLLSS
jgi:hypothetical protein